MENHQDLSPVVLPQVQPAGVVACSICLRVRRETEWIEAEEAIRELRSFEHRLPLRLAAGLCDSCSHELVERRGRRAFAVAA